MGSKIKTYTEFRRMYPRLSSRAWDGIFRRAKERGVALPQYMSVAANEDFNKEAEEKEWR